MNQALSCFAFFSFPLVLPTALLPRAVPAPPLPPRRNRNQQLASEAPASLPNPQPLPSSTARQLRRCRSCTGRTCLVCPHGRRVPHGAVTTPKEPRRTAPPHPAPRHATPRRTTPGITKKRYICPLFFPPRRKSRKFNNWEGNVKGSAVPVSLISAGHQKRRGGPGGGCGRERVCKHFSATAFKCPLLLSSQVFQKYQI